jgi:methionine-rich copper-binding protein CopC
MKNYILTVVTILSMASVSSAFAHAALQTSSPNPSEVVAGSPSAIVLKFNEALEAPFSKITLKDSKGTTLNTEKATVDKQHPETLQQIPPKLAAGSYQVQWSTMTQDGHRAKGQYAFQVK